MTVKEFAEAIATIGRQYKGSVTSWGRSPKRSVAVGGFDGDPHTWWLGVDMVYDTGPNQPLVDILARSLGLKVIHENGHDHFQPFDFPAGPVQEYPVSR